MKKNVIEHLVAVLIMVVVTFAYFLPQLEGKVISGHDNKTFAGMSKEIVDYNKSHDDVALWTNSMFSGMPSYLVSLSHKTNLLLQARSYIAKLIGRPSVFILLTMLGAYFAFCLLGLNYKISLIGSILYSFSSYYFIIIAAGHASKSLALIWMAPIVASVYYAYKKNNLIGSILTAVFLSLSIGEGHVQITYYTAIISAVLVIVIFYDLLMKRKIKHFIKVSSFLIVAVVLAVLTNFSSLSLTYEYGQESIRGTSELSVNAENKTSGLDKDYATDWSYGKAELLTLLIPDAFGGASGAELGEDSEVYKLFKNSQGVAYAKQVIKSMPVYWGPQPFTSGPVYVGAIAVFLFVLGLVLIKGTLKWWLFWGTVVSVILGTGRNMSVNDFFTLIISINIVIAAYKYFIVKEKQSILLYIVAAGILLIIYIPLFIWTSIDLSEYSITYFLLDYLPGYNKFRSVSMSLVIAELSIPLLGIIVFSRIVKRSYSKEEFILAMKIAVGIVAGICLLLAIAPGMFFDFTSQGDAPYKNNTAFYNALLEDRQSIFVEDSLRSLFFVLATAILLLLFYIKKLKNIQYLLVGIGLLMVIDLWGVNKRYLNNENFESERIASVPFNKTTADKQILKDNDPNFRVLNLTVSTFNDASTSYFHKSIGGYHGAKMRRYQELIEHHISPEMQMMQAGFSKVRSQADLDGLFKNLSVINMLNTKYFILPAKSGNMAQLNPYAFGNAWLVNDYKIVDNADEEIETLDEINPREIALVDKRFSGQLNNITIEKDTTAKINLTSYTPNEVRYRYESSKKQLAVFSEIYYSKGWNAYIDGDKVEHFRTNYVLRGMIIPEGNHEITYKFEPKMYDISNMISMVSSIMIVLMVLGVLVLNIKLLYKKW